MKWYHWLLTGAAGYAGLQLWSALQSESANPNPSDRTILPWWRNNDMNAVISEAIKSHSVLAANNPSLIIPHFTGAELAGKKAGIPEDRSLWKNISTAIAFVNDLRCLINQPVTISPGGLFGGKHLPNSEHYQFSAIDFQTSLPKYYNWAIALASVAPAHIGRKHMGFGVYKTFCHVDGGVQYNYPRRWSYYNKAQQPYGNFINLPWYNPDEVIKANKAILYWLTHDHG